MPSSLDDLDASIRECEAAAANAPDPAGRAQLLQQVENLKSLRKLLVSVQPQAEENKKYRKELSAEVRAFFTPEPPAPVPTWLPDTITRAEVTAEAMRCPAGSRVYFDDWVVSTGYTPHGRLPISHGLTLKFHYSGRIADQSMYEHDCLRWWVSYHPSGGRDLVSFYSSHEPLEYREHGLATRFAANGTIITQTWFWDGLRHGWSKFWEDDGYPIDARLYERGVEVEQVLPTGERRRKTN